MHSILFLVVIWNILAFGFSEEVKKEEDEVKLDYNCIQKAEDERKDRLPPVIMIHGLTDNKKTWDGIDQLLAERTGRTVCTIDARNHGDSDWSYGFNGHITNDDDLRRGKKLKAKEVYCTGDLNSVSKEKKEDCMADTWDLYDIDLRKVFSVDVMADDVLKLMEKLKIEKASFVGHSMGGLISMSVAQKQPQKVEKLIVEDITKNISADIVHELKALVKGLVRCMSGVPEYATESQMQESILSCLKKESFEDFSNILSKAKSRYFAVVRRDGAWKWKANMEVIIKALEHPDIFASKEEGVFSDETLFIYGLASPFKVNEQKESILKSFPKSKFVGVEGAGHFIHGFFPQFEIQLLEFLEPSPK